MKKNYFFALLLGVFAMNVADAQIIFQEDFNGANPLTNWTLINNDARTPAANVNFVNNAWVTRADPDTATADVAVVSTSWYTPAGAADDWLITPSISTTTGNFVSWEAKAQDPNFPDGYELRISTTTPTIAGFTANPALFTIGAENASWTSRNISLSAYNNQTIYLAWRNNSNDDFLLYVDNIKVYKPAALDVGIASVVSPVTGCGLGAADSVTVWIKNYGTGPVDSIPVRYAFNNTPPFINGTYFPTINAGDSALFTFASTVNVGTPGSYSLFVSTNLAGDGSAGNNALTTTIVNSTSSFPYTEDFDALTVGSIGNFSNGWIGETSGSFNWIADNNGTATTNSGPSGDNTTGTTNYMYTEASVPAAAGDVATLTSPCIDLSSNPTGIAMDFYYHMFGADITTLFVEVDNNGVWTVVDSIVGQQQTSSSAAWLLRSVNLSAYTNLSDLRVRFRHTRGASFNGDVAIDDVSIYEPVALDAALQSLNVNNSYTVNSVVQIAADIRNAGSSAWTSIKLNYTINNGPVNTDSVAINVAAGGSATLNHSMNWTPATAGTFNDLKVWVSDPNNMADLNNLNDTANLNIWVYSTNSNTVQRKAVLEEYTTAPCQFCPDGAVVVEQILAQNANVIGIGVHSCFGTDAMTNPEALTLCATLGNNSAPTAMVDRTVYPNETSAAFSRANNLWLTRANARAASGAPLDINITGSYTPGAANATITVNTSFVNYPTKNGFNISIAVVEDSVVGFGNGYDQVNFYNTQAGHPYFGAGNPIVGYVHRHVLRDIQPAMWGDENSFPSTIALNTPYSKTYTVPINSAWDANQISIVAMVNYSGPTINDYQIIQAEEVKLNNISTTIEESSAAIDKVSIYPNPASELTNINFSLKNNEVVTVLVRDLAGKLVIKENLGTLSNGRQFIELNTAQLENGFYLVSLQAGEEQITKKISVLH